MNKVEIITMDHQGRGIAKINNKIIFIPNTLVGEIVEINIVEDKKKYAVANVLEIIKKSPKRVNPLCPYYDKCGGCDLMHIAYQEQLVLKEEMIKNIFDRYLMVDVKINKIISGNQFNYRNKITLQVNKKMGYFNKNSYDIVYIDKCLIAFEKINYLISKISNIDLSSVSQIIIKCSKNTFDKMIIFKAKKSLNIDTLKENNLSIAINDKIVYGKDDITEKLNDYEFIISPEAFFQTNTDMTVKLYDTVVKMADFKPNDIVLDLYCGTGTIGIYISKYVKKVLGIEINKWAINDANVNKKLNKINNISFICGDTGEVLEKHQYKPTAIIVDPPRSGLSKKAIDAIKKFNAYKLIYVSCNPMTLVRDLKILSDNYEIDLVTPVDMFPNTHHVECVVVLHRR